MAKIQIGVEVGLIALSSWSEKHRPARSGEGNSSPDEEFHRTSAHRQSGGIQSLHSRPIDIRWPFAITNMDCLEKICLELATHSVLGQAFAWV
jgi:hypothetical protein